MAEVITVELPEEVARQGRVIAAASHRTFEKAIAEWVSRIVADPPLESITDEDLLAICGEQLSDVSQTELDDLLESSREGQINPQERTRLDQLLNEYRSGMIRKAKAVREAVKRGLSPNLNHHAA